MTISVVQSAQSADLAAGCTFGAPLTLGNWLVIMGSVYNGGGPAAPPSSPTVGGSAITPSGSLSGASPSGQPNGVAFAIWLTRVDSAMAGQTVASYSDAQPVRGFALEVSAGGALSIDQSLSGLGNTGNATLGPTGGTAVSGELAVYTWPVFGSNPVVAGGGWTVYSDQSFASAGYQVLGAAGATPSVSATVSPGSNWAAGIVTIQEPGPAGPAVVQAAASANGALSAALTAVGAGNTVVVAAAYQTTAGGYLSTSAPLLGGSPVAGAWLALRCQSSDMANWNSGSSYQTSDSVYIGWWVLPDVTGGETVVSLSGSDASGHGSAVGLLAWEVTGLGAAPVLDRRVAAVGTASAIGSGGTLPATASAGIALAAVTAFGQSVTSLPSPWGSTIGIPNGFLAGGAHSTAAADTPSAGAGTPSGDWAAAVLVLAASLPGGSGTWRDIRFTGHVIGTVDQYPFDSVINGLPGAGLAVQVVQPASPDTSYPHSFFLMQSGDNFQTPITDYQSFGTHNAYNTTLLNVTFNGVSELADNPIAPYVQHETFLLQVIAWAKATLGSGTEKVYYIGESKAGFDGVSLLGRNPGVFEKVSGWDYPAELHDLAGDNDTPPGGSVSPSLTYSYQNWGTDYWYQLNYELSNANLAAWGAAASLTTRNRLLVMGYANYGPDLAAFANRLAALGIRFSTRSVLESTHDWHADYMLAAAAWLFGASSSGLLMASGII